MKLSRYSKVTFVAQAKGYTQNDLAQVLGVSRTMFSRYITGKTPLTLEAAWKIMDFLNIDPRQMAYFFPKEATKEVSFNG